MLILISDSQPKEDTDKGQSNQYRYHLHIHAFKRDGESNFFPLFLFLENLSTDLDLKLTCSLGLRRFNHLFCSL